MRQARPHRDRYTLPQLIAALERAGYTFERKASSDAINRQVMPEPGFVLQPAATAHTAQRDAKIADLLTSNTVDPVDKMILAWFVLSRERSGYPRAIQAATDLMVPAELAERLVAEASAESLTEMLAINPTALTGIDRSTFIWICWALSSVEAATRGGAFITLAVTARRHLERLTPAPAE